MNHLFAYFSAREHEFAACLAKLVHYHQSTGNLPTIPDAPLSSADIASATLPNVGTGQPTTTADVTAGPEAHVPPVQRHDTPDSNGLVALYGVPPHWAAQRYQIAEVTNSLTGDAHGKALRNLQHANDEWNVAERMITVCYETFQAHPDSGWQFGDPPVIIPHTESFPDVINTVHGVNYNFGKVDDVIAWYNYLGEPSLV